jgi:hypothetical protein
MDEISIEFFIVFFIVIYTEDYRGWIDGRRDLLCEVTELGEKSTLEQLLG